MLKTFVRQIGGETTEDRKRILLSLDAQINAFLQSCTEDSIKHVSKAVHVATETTILDGLMLTRVTYNMVPIMGL